MEMATNAIMGAAYGAAGNAVWRFQWYWRWAIKPPMTSASVWKNRLPRCALGGLDQTPETKWGRLSPPRTAARCWATLTAGSAGANLRVDGRGFSVQGHEKGYFVGPTLFDNVTPEMTIYKEEIFGPVLSVVRVADYASAVDLINRHEYGNGSAIFTRDGGCARFCEEVQAGMVGLTCRSGADGVPQFRRLEALDFGALNVHGNDGVRFYRMKTVTARWPEMQQETGAAFSMPTLG